MDIQARRLPVNTRHLITPLLWVALSLPAQAKQPVAVIEGPGVVIPGGSVLLDGRKSTYDEGQRLKWLLIGPTGGGSTLPFLTFDKDGQSDVFCFAQAMPPGLYQFALVAIGKPDGPGPLTADVAIHEIVVNDPSPPPEPPRPGPTPPPGPQPPIPPPGPAPITGPVWVTVINDVSAQTVGLAAVEYSPTLRAALAAKSIHFRVIDVGSELVAKNNYAQFCKDTNSPNFVGTPCLIVQAAGYPGTLVTAKKLPATEAGVLQLIQQVVGR
jgi:hypothetical protein